MEKHRLVITIREGYTYNELLLDNLPLKPVRSIYAPFEDTHVNEHRFPLRDASKETERFHYKSYFYNSLGKKQKELYRTIVIDFDNKDDLANYLNYLESRRESVENFYEDGVVVFFDQPSDPEFINQREVFENLNIEDAWGDATQKGEGIIVSVIDTGVNAAHPDLTQNLWINPLTQKTGFVYKGNVMSDSSVKTNGHGTPIAGIIGAAGNDIGIVGIAPRCQVQMHKLDLKSVLADEAFMIDVIAAIQTSDDKGAKIVNCSFGLETIEFEARERLFKEIKDKSNRMIFVFAAGNSNRPVDSTFLDDLPEVLKVGALDTNDRIKNYSNFGRDVVYAYGDIHTTTKNGSYDTFSGTSAAAPQVAAICALILSHNATIPPAKVKEIIEKSCDNIAGIPSGFGRVNAKKAMYETMKISGRVLA